MRLQSDVSGGCRKDEYEIVESRDTEREDRGYD